MNEPDLDGALLRLRVEVLSRILRKLGLRVYPDELSKMVEDHADRHVLDAIIIERRSPLWRHKIIRWMKVLARQHKDTSVRSSDR